MQLSKILFYLLLFRCCPPTYGSIICFFQGTRRCFLGLGAKLHIGVPGEDTCQETCGLLFFAIFDLFRGYICGSCSDAGLITPQENDPNGFGIDVYGIGIPDSDAEAFITAAARWKEIITGDSGHGPFSAENLEDFQSPGQLLRGCRYPSNGVDDLLICAKIQDIDGGGSGGSNVLGAAGPVRFDGNTQLPVTGAMIFDEFDVAALRRNGLYEDVILHEMGHVMGIGTAWRLNGVQDDVVDCPYTGVAANREYREITGCTDDVPTEPSAAGRGSACSHWEEGSCITNELMTSRLSLDSVISTITIGSLEDIGYTVDFEQGESLVLEGDCCLRRGLDERPRANSCRTKVWRKLCRLAKNCWSPKKPT